VNHKTSAWPLSLVYIGLIVYASLYPFTDWRDQGMAPWAYLLSPLPRYWTSFDLITNVLGYAPLGFLLALSALRASNASEAVMRAILAAGSLSLLMEALQSYLPSRVPSSLDFLLNLAGASLGAVCARLLERAGAIDRWSRFRARWFEPEPRGALVLLVLWPLALLFPAAVPLGLGHVFERLEAALATMLLETPFLDWLPVRDLELQPLVAGAEMLCVMLGLLIPVLLGYCIIASALRRAQFLGFILLAGVAVTALSAALSYGPAHAWAWFSRPVGIGLLMATVLASLMLKVPGRVCAILMLPVLGLYLSVLNQAPTNAYFAHNLHAWEQGRFIRFHGLGQWLGWLWPYATLVYVLIRIAKSRSH
jgi:VanZ family protein